MAELIAHFALGVLRICVLCYDVVTFPVYYVVQRPWSVKSKCERARARQVNPNDPYSAWIRIGQAPTHYIQQCKTLDELFRKSVKHWGGRPCCARRHIIGEEDEKQPDGKVLKKLILSDYEWMTYLEMDDKIDQVGRALLATGLKPRDRVLIFAETRLEWMICAQAIVRIGCTVCTLYATLGDEGIIHGINETEVTHIITTHDLLPKLKKLQTRIAKVNCIIYMEGGSQKPQREGFNDDIKILSFSELEELGRKTPPPVHEIRNKPDDIAVILYTSGSTGVPKGVMISHRNFVAAVCSFLGIFGSLLEQVDKHSYIAYLPLAHILEFTAECFCYGAGVKVGYGTPNTLTDTSTSIKSGQRGDAPLFCPTLMAAVPLVLDRIRKGIVEKVSSRGPFARGLFEFSIQYKKYWARKYLRAPIVNALICKKMKATVGGKLQYVLCGGAPLSPDTQEFIRSCLDVQLSQGYGATETCASTSLQDLDDQSSGRVGAPHHGVQIKLRDWEEGGYCPTDKPNPRGEILVGGAGVSQGYFKLENETREAFFEQDGAKWFATGDIGEMCPDGVLKIIDRKKDLVKLQFGEYVSLGKVESELKSCSYVENICVYGNSYQNYVVALVVPNENALNALAQQLHKDKLSREELCDDDKITAAVCKALQEHAKKAGLHRSEIPTKCKLVTEEWTPDSGFVTAAMKLRRKNIQEYYMDDINEMYNGPSMVDKNKPELNVPLISPSAGGSSPPSRRRRK